ncbi:MAG: uracil-DNA glycosylase [Ardenticatenales bacterium]
MNDSLAILESDVTACRACPRLVAWREHVAATKRAAYADQEYWGRPVPGFGDPAARLLIVGLAPGAHGSNRTGRVFTGDGSGQWLYRSLHRAGLASQPHAVSRDDGLKLHGAWITAAVRCAPPANKPTPDEWAACRPFLVRELALLPDVRVVVALGAFAWQKVLDVGRGLDADAGWRIPRPAPAFGHAADVDLGAVRLIGCYHPSQQNTFTGKLTESMLDDVWGMAGRG